MATKSICKIVSVVMIFNCMFFCSPNNNDSYLSQLKNDCLSGNNDSYQALRNYLLDSKPSGLLYYSLYMANEYNNTDACMDVYEIISTYFKHSDYNLDCVDYNLECLHEDSKELALKYFRKAIENGDETSSEILLDYYDKEKYNPIEELYTDTALIAKAKLNIQLWESTQAKGR